ncbi:MAG: hypothetical protein GX182_01925 [Firmicutes bacterium]|jgi:hypothetical protein|nr:hypothetical protein [Bacillota bacterium]
MKLPPDVFHRKTAVSLPFADRFLRVVDRKALDELHRELERQFSHPLLRLPIRKESDDPAK